MPGQRLAVLAFTILTSPALAQTPAPTSPTGAATPATGLGDTWWIVLLALVVVLALWLVARRRRGV
jgi:LPXTG-motif cell wall-anchored protein